MTKVPLYWGKCTLIFRYRKCQGNLYPVLGTGRVSQCILQLGCNDSYGMKPGRKQVMLPSYIPVFPLVYRFVSYSVLEKEPPEQHFSVLWLAITHHRVGPPKLKRTHFLTSSGGTYLAIQLVSVWFGQVFWNHPNTTEMNGIPCVVLPALKKIHFKNLQQHLPPETMSCLLWVIRS